MRNCSRRLAGWVRRCRGVTLVDFLVGTAVTVTVALTVSSILTAAQTSQIVLRQQTDQYESVRQVAEVMLQDARFATNSDCGLNDSLKLYTKTGSMNDYILYQFADADDNPDPTNIHRIVVVAGVVQRDDVVGWNLVPTDPWTESTYFECINGLRNRTALVHLVKEPGTANSPPIVLEFKVYLRV